MKTYTEEQLIAFGNYLLSDERKKMVKRNNRQMIHHADIENFKTIGRIEDAIKFFGISGEGIYSKFEIVDDWAIVGTFWDMALNLRKEKIENQNNKAEGRIIQ